MITIDETVKLILVISVSFAIVVIAYQLARFIASATGLMQELRKPLKNVTELSDLAVDDYKRVRGLFDVFKGMGSSIDSLKGLFDIFKRFGGEENEEKDQSVSNSDDQTSV